MFKWIKRLFTKKYYVSIGCKIYTDSYPFLVGYHTGDEIYEHLISSLGHCFEDPKDTWNEPDRIPGDHAIWYLGCNEKFGGMFIKTKQATFTKEWSFGESSFQNVRDFIIFLMIYKVITTDQYNNLNELTSEGEKINDMYQISNYLKTKRSGKEWVSEDSDMRTGIKKMMGNVKDHFEKNDYIIIKG